MLPLEAITPCLHLGWEATLWKGFWGDAGAWQLSAMNKYNMKRICSIYIAHKHTFQKA